MINIPKAPTGNRLNTKGWRQEAALRLLLNNLDPVVAKDPQNLIVYGGKGKAARNPEALFKIIDALKGLENDETLLIQSGKPVGIFRTTPESPRVLISNAQIVPRWATDEYFWDLEKRGLTMYGQMTAGSWIYIGTQGIIQGTYETLSAIARKEFKGDSLDGRLFLSSGLGEMGGAQPLAAKMNGASCLIVEVDSKKIERRIAGRYLDTWTDNTDRALEIIEKAKSEGKPVSVGLLGNAAAVYPELLSRGIRPDIVSDQTAAHDLDFGYIPVGYSVEEADSFRKRDIKSYRAAVYSSIVREAKAILAFRSSGSIVFDYGNNFRTRALEGGLSNAFDIPGYVPEYIRDLFAVGSGPFRWVALSGKPEDIYRIDDEISTRMTDNPHLVKWIKLARDGIKFQGLPARICYASYGEREKIGLIINNLVRDGEVSAPVAIGRDHHDTGSVASPFRETEKMKDGSDAIADWPILNALLNAVSGASWVSVHHGGGTGIGNSIHAGFVLVADGTMEADERIRRVMNADSGIGVIRHADAGYTSSIDLIKKGVKFKAPYFK